MESTRDNEQAECISESHLQFMRDYVAREEAMCKAALERFLAGKFRPSANPRASQATVADLPEPQGSRLGSLWLIILVFRFQGRTGNCKMIFVPTSICSEQVVFVGMS